MRPSLLFLLPLVLAGSLLAGEARALWLSVSQDEIAAASDLIVLAELEAGGETAAGVSYGVLRISDVLAGDGALTDVRLLLPEPGAPLRSTDVFYKPGAQGIWYLRLDDPVEGIYAADHPQRMLPGATIAGAPGGAGPTSFVNPEPGAIALFGVGALLVGLASRGGRARAARDR